MTRKRKGKYILVIEDDEGLCDSILENLQTAGYRCMGVNNLKEASFKLQNQKYECILLDMQLGAESGMSVIELVRSRKGSQNPDTPIVVVSGYLDKVLLKKIASQIQGALVKPFDTKMLLSTVDKLTDSA